MWIMGLLYLRRRSPLSFLLYFYLYAFLKFPLPSAYVLWELYSLLSVLCLHFILQWRILDVKSKWNWGCCDLIKIVCNYGIKWECIKMMHAHHWRFIILSILLSSLHGEIILRITRECWLWNYMDCATVVSLEETAFVVIVILLFVCLIWKYPFLYVSWELCPLLSLLCLYFILQWHILDAKCKWNWGCCDLIKIACAIMA